MKERIRPAPEAMERIRQLGERKILLFLEDVTLGSTRSVADFLPVVRGFRPYTEAGIKQQRLLLAKKLSSKNGAADRDFLALYWIWRAWAWEQLGDPDTVEHLLDGLESAVTQAKPQGDGANETVRAATNTFLNALKQLSLENKCSREKIARLIDFSPLAVDDAAQQIVNSCKSEADIERDKTITDLPNRLRTDEREIQSTKDRLAAVAADAKNAVTKAGLIEQKSEGYTRALRAISDTVDRLGHAILAVEDSSGRNADAVERLEKRSEELATQVRSSESRHDEIDSRLKTTAQSINEAIHELRSVVEPLQNKLSGISPASADALESIAKEVQAIGAKVLALPQKPASENVDDIKKRPETIGATSRTEAINISEQGGVSVTTLACPANASRQPLADLGQIIGALSGNLQSVGLKKSAARLLAEEVSAAILTRQAVSFKGALAHLVARKCAETLNRGQASNISIPIGLSDGRSLDTAFRSLSSQSSINVTSIVVEGLNRSALDSTKDVLLAYVTDQTANQESPIFCFISLVSGIASLPIEPEYLELGPVFDLDYLDWRISPERSAENLSSSVASSRAASMRAELTQRSADDIDETLRVVRKFMSRRNPRIERAVAASYVALKKMRQAGADASPLQSLAYGWLVPLWVALGVSKEEADSELDGGKCDSPNADARIAAMLNHEPFEPTGRK